MIYASILSAINIVWVALIVGTIVIELSTEELDCIWFTAGAIVALILSLVGVHSIVIQIVVFAVVSCALILTVGRWSKKFFESKNIPTNIDAAIGKEIVVLSNVDHLHNGEGKYDGVTYTLICSEGDSVNKGDVAIIQEVIGNKFRVKKEEK